MSPHFDEPQLRTTRYYDAHAEVYVQSTRDLDLEELYRPFLAHLAPGGAILDAGCGSGRDALYFRNAGYRVSAIDASPRMVELSSELLGQEVRLATLQSIEYSDAFDGIWACASLLHVPRAEMGDVFNRLRRALRAGGVLYASFKCGTEEGWEGERFFNRYDEDQLRVAVEDIEELVIHRLWRTADLRSNRTGEQWLNVLAHRVD